MTDVMTREQRSAHMARIRSSRTKPELLFHAILKGLRVKHKMWPELPGHPDAIVYPTRTAPTAVFVHGCFWHGCPRHFRLPKSNRRFWAEKITRNAARHRRAAAELRRVRLRVVVVWEHDLRPGAVDNRAVRRAAGLIKYGGKNRS